MRGDLRSTASGGSRSVLALSSFRFRARLDLSIPSTLSGQRGCEPRFLGEHLLCKHAVISSKSLNRRLLIVQTPLQVGLLTGLQILTKDTLSKFGQTLRKKWTRFESNEHYRRTTSACSSAIGEATRGVIQNPKHDGPEIRKSFRAVFLS
jgi:hypothetical protein